MRGTILGVPGIRTIVFWGLYWGPPILGNYQMSKSLRAPVFGVWRAGRKSGGLKGLGSRSLAALHVALGALQVFQRIWSHSQSQVLEFGSGFDSGNRGGKINSGCC